MLSNDSGPVYEDRPAPDSSHRSDLYPMRVLVIYDGEEMPGILRHLSDGIEDGKYVVTRASTIADGFGEMVTEVHDAYIVGHHVGAKTGFELLDRVNAEGLRLPIVFVAAEGDHAAGISAVGAGASFYVVEDMTDAMVFDHCLRNAVDQRKALSQLTTAGVSIGGGSPTKAQILSHVAGRMRAPATAMLEAARRSMADDLPEHALESFAHVENKALALLTLADDLADLCSLESGRLEFDTATFDLRGLVANVEKMLAASTDTPGVTLETEVASEVPESLIGDPGRLRLAVLRFVENVIDRSSNDHVLMSIDVADHGSETITLRFQIRTDGCVASDRVANPADSGTESSAETSSQGGFLGMPVALETVSRMGGRVAISDETDGTCGIEFVVRLQLGETEPTQRPTTDDPSTNEQSILIIADALEDRRSIVKSLAESGFSYVATASVKQWIDTNRLGQQSDALPALAVIASTEDSFDTCDRLIEVSPTRIPTVVIAKIGQRGDAARCRKRGVKGYLSEPMERNDVADVVRAVLGLVQSGDSSTLVTRHWLREGLPSLRVLVTDDSYTSRFLLTRMLDQRGHSAATASDGSEAVEALEQDTFDVVLMDVMMPVMDGFEATRRIRAMYHGSGNGPIIIGMSAIKNQASKDRGRDAGMDDFLAKPVRPDDLFAIIERQAVSKAT